MSSNINKVIRAVLFFFTIRFHKHKKTPKALEVKKAQTSKSTKIKHVLKKIKVEKSLYNRNASSTKPVKVLYKRKLVY